MTRRGPIRNPAQSALVAFESVARLGSFSRAAKELGTSEPAISHYIAMLEKHALNGRLVYIDGKLQTRCCFSLSLVESPGDLTGLFR